MSEVWDTGRSADAAADLLAGGPWPVWEWPLPEPHERADPVGLLHLGRYVSEAAIGDSKFRPGTIYTDGGPAQGRTAAAAAYDLYLQSELLYGHEPYLLHGSGQRIRPPRQMQEDKATCLDLAAAYAATCVEAQLRAHVVLLEEVIRDPRSGQELWSFHALVLLDLRATFGDGDEADPLPKPFERYDDAPWVHEVTGGRTDALPEHVIAVDIALAARAADSDPEDFGPACASGAGHLAGAERVYLVDVRAARAADPGFESGYPPPPRQFLPAISSWLPGGYAYRAFPSRADDVERVMDASGRIVLVGESGSGKSTLAHRRASRADHGYGWFLTASDRRTLVNQLAEAELAERPLRGEGDVFDPESLAQAALARLIGSKAPWVVVLDNADCRPAELRGLIPRPERSQTLIVTSTDDAWLDASWARQAVLTPVTLEPVDREDLQDADHPVPTWVWEAIDGSPLLARAVLGAVREGATPEDGSAGLPGAELAWRLARSVPDLPQAALEAALLLAWLPAEPTRLATLEKLGVPAPEPAVGRLDRLGLVDRGPGGVSRMHRLLRAAVRDEPPDVATDPVIEILHRAGDSRIAVGRDNLLLGAELSLLTLMSARLDGRDEPTPASAWFCLGRVLEYRGTVKDSVVPYEKAEQTTGAANNLTPAMASACLLGQARWANQNNKATLDEVLAGQALAQQAADLVTGSRAPGDMLAHHRARAMVALLSRKLADRGEKTASERRALLEEAVEVLLDSLERRREVIEDHPELNLDDVDRGVFNLGGTYLLLARGVPHDEAAALLQRSWDAYETARAIRTERFGARPNPHVASCIAGLMMVPYYEVVLDAFIADLDHPGTSRDPIERERLRHERLRESTDYAIAALAQRQFFEGDLDGNDTAKTTQFLAKVALARVAVAAAAAAGAAPDAARTDVEKVVSGFYREVSDWVLPPAPFTEG